MSAEAQELVEWYDVDGFAEGTKAPHKWVLRAAEELRRLREEIQCEERRFNELWEQFCALDKLNQELLEALDRIDTAATADAAIDPYSKTWTAIANARITLEKAAVVHGRYVNAFFEQLAKDQQPLGDDFQRVLDEHRWDLYEPGEKQ